MKKILNLVVLVLLVPLVMSACDRRYNPVGLKCTDADECTEHKDICGPRAKCYNSDGSYICMCATRLVPRHNEVEHCEDGNGCRRNVNNCSSRFLCDYFKGSYYCQCQLGSAPALFSEVEHCEDPDATDGANGETPPTFEKRLLLLRNSILAGNQTSEEELMQVVNVTDAIQQSSSGTRWNSGEVSGFLRLLEQTVDLIARQPKQNSTRITTDHTELEVVVTRDRDPPKGQIRLRFGNQQLDITWKTVIGDQAGYLGFGYVFLLGYTSPMDLFRTSDHLSSSVTTVSVSNPNKTRLPEPVNITFTHLQPIDKEPLCVYWSEELGAWSSQGCSSLVSNSTLTVCSCRHLSSFALITSIHKEKMSVTLLVGISATVSCVILSLVTMLWCRRVSKRRSPRR